MSERSPWTTSSSRLVYDNAWIRVREDQVTRPDGLPGIYGVVEFKTHATGVVPLTEDGDTFLVGQFRYSLDEYSWEIPEGGSPKNESPLASAQRELIEETGIRAERWTYLGDLHTSNSVTDERGAVYLAEGLTFGQSQPEGTERLEIRRVPFSQAWLMAMRGEITDSVSIIALARVRAYLEMDRQIDFTGLLAGR